MVTDIVIMVAKYGSIVLLILLIRWILKPYFAKRHYMKYSNVAVNPETHLFYGESKILCEGTGKKLTEVEVNLKQIKERSDVDLRVYFFYRDVTVNLCSHKAVSQFKQLCPNKIDRSDFEKRMYGKMYATSFDKIRFSNEWKKRQQLFFKHGNIKNPSVVIPIMIEQLEQRINSWDIDKEIEFVDEFGDMTSKVICTTLFGSQFLSAEGVGLCNIKLKDGSYQKMTFTEAVRFIPDECDDSNDSLLASMFPSLNNKSLIEPFKTDSENIREIHRVLLNFCTKNGTRDKCEIEILKNAEGHLKNIDETSFINDLFNLLDAGSGTILFAITSCLFRLKQYPEVMNKLMKELEQNGVKELVRQRDKFTSEESQSAINKCEYLGYVVKESLRIDPPSLGSSAYESVDDIVICDVPVPKGTIMYVNTLCSHFNSQQWYEPFKFIPERFDPSSNYYTKPGSDDIRDSNSYIPFSVGPRTCPAAKFATYEIKSMVSYFLCRVEYQLEQSQIDQDIHIGLEGIQELYGKITKKC